jgi:hypothetical protein
MVGAASLLSSLAKRCAADQRCAIPQEGIAWARTQRRLLKRSSFTSLDDLKTRALQFIEYWSSVLAKPFRWTYTGRPLQA